MEPGPYGAGMTTPGEHRIDLGHGVFIDYCFTGPGAIDFQLWWESVELAHGSIDEQTPAAKVEVDTKVARAEMDLTIDGFLGEVLCSASIQIWDTSANPPGWTSIVACTNDVLVHFDPTKGMVAGRATADPPVVQGPWGPSGPSGDGVTRFHITDQPRVLADVGPEVKARMFPAYSPLVLNIVACCGRPTGSPSGPGVYADPESPWFNVFFGVYQMDCAVTDGWTRPFGYESAAGVASVVHGEDLVRIGKSDWNWFSNYMYGVPSGVCAQYSSVDMGAVTFTPTETIPLGSTTWHCVTMSGVEVASAYQSDASGAAQLVENSLLTDEWRKSFGEPSPRPEYPTSFIPTKLQSTLLMTYWQDAAGFHTLMFGGTSGIDTDPAFLAAQVSAAKQTIVDHYPTAGFAPS